MKGIILAGGIGSRLAPMTWGVSKQLLPVYDKPMIYYPLSVLMLAGIREIMIISSPRDLPLIKNVLEDGSQWGLTFSYCEQEKPEGIAQAFLLAEEFINNEPVCLILGDNVIYGHELIPYLQEGVSLSKGAHIFATRVRNPQRYGVVAFNQNGDVTSIMEKPAIPTSNYVVTGLYFYDQDVVNIARGLKPSARGELEITDVNNVYLKRGQLKASRFGRGMAWLDAGTPDALLSASQYVQTIEMRHGLKIACVEEIAYEAGMIDRKQLMKLAENYAGNNYGQYLTAIADER